MEKPAAEENIFKPLIEFTAAFPLKNIPPRVMQCTGELFSDALGCIYGGRQAAGVDALINVHQRWRGAEIADVLGHSFRTIPPDAALINAVMAHSSDYDDTHDEAVHHGTVTLVPALLATVQDLASQRNNSSLHRRVSGEEFLGALALGLEIANRIGVAYIENLPVGMLPTTLWGTIASACAVSRLLHLSVEQTLYAAGIAYTQIHGNRQALIEGTLAKRMQPGFSAAAGIRSAYYAAEGITAPRRILDGIYGISALYTKGKMNADRLLGKLGSSWETERISIKPYPCCRCTHPVIDAARTLYGQGIRAQTITSGSIFLPPTSMGQIGQPFSPGENPTVSAQFSAQYTAALAICKGEAPELSDFEAQKVLEREEIHKLAAKFTVIQHMDHLCGLTPVRIEVELKDHRTREAHCEHPLGSPSQRLSREELQRKFMDNLLYGGIAESAARADEIWASLQGITQCRDTAAWIESLPG